MNKPTVGRIVHYVLSEQDCGNIRNQREVASIYFTPENPAKQTGKTKRGNPPIPGVHVAMVIVAVFPGNSNNRVNGQVLLDGNDSHWVTSVAEGEGGGTWHWPERELE